MGKLIGAKTLENITTAGTLKGPHIKEHSQKGEKKKWYRWVERLRFSSGDGGIIPSYHGDSRTLSDHCTRRCLSRIALLLVGSLQRIRVLLKLKEGSKILWDTDGTRRIPTTQGPEIVCFSIRLPLSVLQCEYLPTFYCSVKFCSENGFVFLIACCFFFFSTCQMNSKRVKVRVLTPPKCSKRNIPFAEVQLGFSSFKTIFRFSSFDGQKREPTLVTKKELICHPCKQSVKAILGSNGKQSDVRSFPDEGANKPQFHHDCKLNRYDNKPNRNMRTAHTNPTKKKKKISVFSLLTHTHTHPRASGRRAALPEQLVQLHILCFSVVSQKIASFLGDSQPHPQ